MAVYPKGNKFMASVGAGPTRVRRTFLTEAEGLAWEESQEAARGASKAPPAPPAPAPTGWTLQKAFDHTLLHRWKGTGGERKAILNATQALVFFGPETSVSAINAKWIVEWMEELKGEHENSNATLNKKLSALKVMLTESLDIGGLDTVPRMKRYTEATRSPHWYSDADERAMLDMALRMNYPELHRFISIGMDTGFRRGELLGLVSSDYHKGNLLIHADATKGKMARAVPCSARVRGILAECFKDGERRVFPGLTDPILRTQWEELRAALKRTNDPYFIPHTMRHTCATRLVAEGVPLKSVKEWLGHGVIESTMVYAHLAPGLLDSAAAKLDTRETNMAAA